MTRKPSCFRCRTRGNCGSLRPDGTTRRWSSLARVLELRSGTRRRGADSAPPPGQKVTCNAPRRDPPPPRPPLVSVEPGGMAHLLCEARARRRRAGARPPVAGRIQRTGIAPHLAAVRTRPRLRRAVTRRAGNSMFVVGRPLQGREYPIFDVIISPLCEGGTLKTLAR
jgi:hypothetical protein